MPDRLKRRHTDQFSRRSTDKNDNDTLTQHSISGQVAESISNYHQNGNAKDIQKNKIKILVAIRQSILRFGVASLLSEQSDFHVVGTAGNCAECHQNFLQFSPQVLLCDFETNNSCPLNGCSSKAHCDVLPDIPTILLQDDQHKQQILHELSTSIHGYLTTNTRLDDLFKAIRIVKDGGSFIEHRMQSRVMGMLGQLHNGKMNEKEQITDRDLMLLQMLAKGKRNQDIADDMSLSSSTVKRYLSSLYTKLGASNRVEAVSIGIANRFISAE